MLKYLVVPAAVLLAAPASAVPAAPELPAWMEGCWVEARGADWTEECWMAPRGGMMMGASRSGTGDRIASWEYLRIETGASLGDGSQARMAYQASPQGRGWVSFVWNPTDKDEVAFFNLANDYPQRIRYWREGAILKAEIALRDGSRARVWTYKPGRMRD